MNESEARKILGLSSKKNPRRHIAEYEKNLARKRGFVENSPSPETKARYQEELEQYQAAHEVIVSLSNTQQKRRHTGFLLTLLLIAVVSFAGWWAFHLYQLEQEEANQQNDIIHQKRLVKQNQQRIQKLNREGKAATAKRKWKFAEDAYNAILHINPHSKIAREGQEIIKKGKLEERNQKIFYTLGNSQAAMEAGNWDEARQLALSVLKQNPGHQAAIAKLEQIEQQRLAQEVVIKVQLATKAVDVGDLDTADQILRELVKVAPNHVSIPLLMKRINVARAEIQQRLQQANDLFQQASQLDNGQYSPKAIALLDDAKRLNPDNAKIRALYEKMSNYTRTIQVPGDVATISEALAGARPRDRILVAPGTYRESLTIHVPVRLEGSADGKTIIEMPATDGSLVIVTAEGTGTYLSSLTLNHAGFDLDEDRGSAVIIQGAKVTIDSCSVTHAAGHGIAVIAGAHATITGCKVSDAGWDGISVYGEGSRADIRDSYSQNNLQHGVEFWKGGSGTVSNSRILGNGLCGVLAMSPGTAFNIKTTLCARNRGAGILVSDQVIGEIVANRCDKNLLSGIVARGVGTSVSIINCVTTGNQEAGILIYRGVTQKALSQNKATGNKLRQIWLNAQAKK